MKRTLLLITSPILAALWIIALNVAFFGGLALLALFLLSSFGGQ